MFHLGNSMSKTSAEGEDGAGEGKNESLSWRSGVVGERWGRKSASVCACQAVEGREHQPRNFGLYL